MRITAAGVLTLIVMIALAVMAEERWIIPSNEPTFRVREVRYIRGRTVMTMQPMFPMNVVGEMVESPQVPQPGQILHCKASKSDPTKLDCGKGGIVELNMVYFP